MPKNHLWKPEEIDVIKCALDEGKKPREIAAALPHIAPGAVKSKVNTVKKDAEPPINMSKSTPTGKGTIVDVTSLWSFFGFHFRKDVRANIIHAKRLSRSAQESDSDTEEDVPPGRPSKALKNQADTAHAPPPVAGVVVPDHAFCSYFRIFSDNEFACLILPSNAYTMYAFDPVNFSEFTITATSMLPSDQHEAIAKALQCKPEAVSKFFVPKVSKFTLRSPVPLNIFARKTETIGNVLVITVPFAASSLTVV